MNKIKSIAIAAILMALSATNTNAQLPTTATHGGIVQKSGNYTIEMVKSQNKIMFYVQDANKKVIANKEGTGSVTFKFADNTSSNIDLSTLGDDCFLVINEKEGMISLLTITLKIKGKTYTATYKNVQGATKPHGHSHDEDGHHH